MAMGSHLLAARSPPPTLFPVPKPSFVAGRVPRPKIQHAGNLRSLSICYAYKKSTSQSKGMEGGNPDVSDYDDQEENAAGVQKRKSKKVSGRGRRRKEETSDDEDGDNDGDRGVTARATRGQPRQTSSRRSREKIASDDSEDEEEAYSSNNVKKVRATRRKVGSSKGEALEQDSTGVKKHRLKQAIPISSVQDASEPKTKARKTRKKSDDLQEESSSELSDTEEPVFIRVPPSSGRRLARVEDDDEDISFMYGWPALVCCFGAAQDVFVPSGRPANRLINHEIHETMADCFWSPEKFVRAPGRSSSNVAITLADLGGRVAFMGKLGDDAYGQSLLAKLNTRNVQTTAVRFDERRRTAVSYMKISKKGALRMIPLRPCAEDCLHISEISNAVLKEAKIFYFNSLSLMDPKMRITTMQAVQRSKNFGGIIFYDLNLPLPLWRSRDDTITFIEEAWKLADVIEVTKQELELICGIEPTEKFDTKDNDQSKFTHYEPEVIMPLWHENLKILFVTNGTSKIHYYTEDDDGWVLGTEDVPITPYTADMSASGDGIVAGIMKMLSTWPEHITDEHYIMLMCKNGINRGINSQWSESLFLGYPAPKDSGFQSISEKEYRTIGYELEDDDQYVADMGEEYE